MDNGITIHSLLLILKRRRNIIGWTTATCFILAILACIFMTRRYEAIGEIQVQKTAADGLGLENMMSAAGGASDALDANITLQTQANILRSNTLALKVIEDLNLENTQDYKPVFNPVGWVLGLISPSGPADAPNTTLENAPRRRDRAINIFSKRLKVKPVGGTRLIDVTYVSADPKIAAAVINDLTKSLVDYSFQTRFNATNQVSEWLGAQLADLKNESEKLQGKVVQLQRESGMYNLGISDSTGKEMAYSTTLDRLQQATLALTEATSNRILKGGLYKMVQNGDPELISGLAGSALAGASPAVNSSFSLLQTLRSQQAVLRSQIASDTSKYGSANPKLSDERASLGSVDGEIQSEVHRIGERAANDYKASQLVEDNLRGVYNERRQSADKLNDRAIELMAARQEALGSRTLYENLFSHLKEAGVLEGLRSSNVTVVDPGRVPSKPVRPNVPVYLALSLLGGCILGMVGVLFLEATDDRIQSMELVEQSLRAPILAVLPMVQLTAPKGALGNLAARMHRQLAGGNDLPVSRRIPAIDGPNSAFVEGLRALRTSLLLSRSGAPPKVILITSAVEEEGKTMVTMNLAAVMAQNGSRVLLVEGDMRHPGLSHLLNLNDRRSGLSSVLATQDEPTFMTPFQELPGLSVLPAGAIPPYPAELLGAKRMRALIGAWSVAYDFVLIDSPPILAVTDALILSRLADMTLLVARHGVSTRRSLERAYRTLHEDEKSHVSVVLNGVARDSVSFGEFAGYNGSKYYNEV